MRALTLIAALTLPASAQPSAPHPVPFASVGNAVELAVAGPIRSEPATRPTIQ